MLVQSRNAATRKTARPPLASVCRLAGRRRGGRYSSTTSRIPCGLQLALCQRQTRPAARPARRQIAERQITAKNPSRPPPPGPRSKPAVSVTYVRSGPRSLAPPDATPQHGVAACRCRERRFAARRAAARRYAAHPRFWRQVRAGDLPARGLTYAMALFLLAAARCIPVAPQALLAAYKTRSAQHNAYNPTA